jgi:hypothetical protein
MSFNEHAADDTTNQGGTASQEDPTTQLPQGSTQNISRDTDDSDESGEIMIRYNHPSNDNTGAGPTFSPANHHPNLAASLPPDSIETQATQAASTQTEYREGFNASEMSEIQDDHTTRETGEKVNDDDDDDFEDIPNERTEARRAAWQRGELSPSEIDAAEAGPAQSDTSELCPQNAEFYTLPLDERIQIIESQIRDARVAIEEARGRTYTPRNGVTRLVYSEGQIDETFGYWLESLEEQLAGLRVEEAERNLLGNCELMDID